MSDRRRRANAKNKTFAYVAAGLVHLVIIVLLVFNFANKPKLTEAAYAENVELVKANTVDESVIEERQNALKEAERKRELEKELKRKRLEELENKARDEERKLKDLEEKTKEEKKKAELAEAERKRIALKKKKEDDERKQREAKEKRKKEAKRLAEKKAREKKAELERLEKKKRDDETQRLLNESLAAEEAFKAEQLAKQRATTLMGKYTALITNRVKSKWSVSPSFERWRTAKVEVKLSPSGDVLAVAIVKSSGSQQFDRSVETAVRQATPLPIPTVEEDPEVNKLFQSLTFNIDMSGM